MQKRKNKVADAMQYTACIWMMGCFGFMIMNLEKADTILPVWAPLTIAGVILAFVSILLRVLTPGTPLRKRGKIFSLYGTERR